MRIFRKTLSLTMALALTLSMGITTAFAATGADTMAIAYAGITASASTPVVSAAPTVTQDAASTFSNQVYTIAAGTVTGATIVADTGIVTIPANAPAGTATITVTYNTIPTVAAAAGTVTETHTGAISAVAITGFTPATVTAGSAVVTYASATSTWAVSANTGSFVTGAVSAESATGFTLDGVKVVVTDAADTDTVTLTAVAPVVAVGIAQTGVTKTATLAVAAVPVVVPAAKPVITTQPVAQALPYTGSQQTFTALNCTAAVTDGGALTYQWHQVLSAGATGDTAISGATSATYTPDSAKLVGSKQYYVVVTNTLAGQTATTTSNTVSVGITPKTGANDVALKTLSYTVTKDSVVGASTNIAIVPAQRAYTVHLPLGFSSIVIAATADTGATYTFDPANKTITTDGMIKIDVVAASGDNAHYEINFVTGNAPTPPPADGGNAPTPPESTANKPETIAKVNDALDALKDIGTIDPEKLPAGVTAGTTADGKAIATVPVAMDSGAADVGLSLFNTLGAAPSNVGIKFTVKNGFYGASADITVPGGFGAIKEAGRVVFPMSYKEKADGNDLMLKYVKTEGATSFTSQIGVNYKLPVAATISLKTKIKDGASVNVYNFDADTNKFVLVGTPKIVDGKVAFSTQLMGQFLITTGKL